MNASQYEAFFRRIFLQLLQEVFALQVLDRRGGHVLLGNESDVVAVLFSPNPELIKALKLVPQDFTFTEGSLVGGFVWAVTSKGEITKRRIALVFGSRKWPVIHHVFVLHPTVIVRDELKDSELCSVANGIESLLVGWAAHELRHMAQAMDASLRVNLSFETGDVMRAPLQSQALTQRYANRDMNRTMRERIVSSYGQAYQHMPPNKEFWFAMEFDAYGVQIQAMDYWLVSEESLRQKMSGLARLIRQP